MPRILVEPFTIAAESIDLNGHVNNQEYVRWMQDIATAHSHEQGWTVARYLDTKTTWVIRSHYIEYIRPAFMGDDLMVATWVAGMAVQTSPRKYRFVRVRDGKTIVEAETLWVTATRRLADRSPLRRKSATLFPWSATRQKLALQSPTS